MTAVFGAHEMKVDHDVLKIDEFSSETVGIFVIFFVLVNRLREFLVETSEFLWVDFLIVDCRIV